MVKTSSGVNVISWLAAGARDNSFSLYVRFRVVVPELISFSDGVVVVKTKPGFIFRIWVDVSFVSSLVRVSFETLNSWEIVVDCRVSVSL